MFSTLLVTLIVLLADGSPGKRAYLSCPDVAVSRIGSDNGEQAENGARLVLDSRGAAILNVEKPTTIFCEAFYGSQVWRGRVALTKADKVVRIWLEESYD